MNYTLNFFGYWPVPASRVAAFSGVYCIYAVNQTMYYLLYVGEANNIEFRIAHHEKHGDWARAANGLPLYFNAASIEPVGARKFAEAAMINFHKPPCNIEYVNRFPYQFVTTVTTTGANVCIRSRFTVYPS